MNRLLPVTNTQDIFPIYRDTPIGRLLEYHNLARPHDSYLKAELLIGMCMDNRKHLHIPDNFAFIIRAGGANLRYSEFKVSYAIAVGEVSAIALIGHTQCAMVNLIERKAQFVQGLVERAGWKREAAEEHFDQFAPTFSICSTKQISLPGTEPSRVPQRIRNAEESSPMNRIDRLLGILTTLQSKKYTTADSVAEQFGMSIRTVYRDMKALGEIGVPIAFENHKGYFVVEGYFLPPITFTTDEANAFVLIESIIGTVADASIKKSYESAVRKVKTVLRESQRNDLDFLQSQIRTDRLPSGKGDSTFLSTLQQSIIKKTVLEIEYENSQQVRSTRNIEPIGMLFYNFQWHVIAWCCSRNDYRDFRVDRILQLKDTNQSFAQKNPMTVDEYLKKYW